MIAAKSPHCLVCCAAISQHIAEGLHHIDVAPLAVYFIESVRWTG
jgi:hypothetical protein